MPPTSVESVSPSFLVGLDSAWLESSSFFVKLSSARLECFKTQMTWDWLGSIFLGIPSSARFGSAREILGSLFPELGEVQVRKEVLRC